MKILGVNKVRKTPKGQLRFTLYGTTMKELNCKEGDSIGFWKDNSGRIFLQKVEYNYWGDDEHGYWYYEKENGWIFRRNRR